MRIADGRTCFYQWDMDQQLIVEEGITEVHYDNGTTAEALCCLVKEVDGEHRVDVPNIFLQTAASIHAYAWSGKSVISHVELWVEPRDKPADYVYTQTEVRSVEAAVAAAIQAAKANGEFTGPQGPQGPQGLVGPQGPQGEPGDPAPAEVFIAEYGVTTFAEMDEAYSAGKVLFLRTGSYLVPMYNIEAGISVSFYRTTSSQIINYYRTAKGNWSQKTLNLCAAIHKEFGERISMLEQTPIAFYVGDTPHMAQFGMTWGQFVDSDYNQQLTCVDCGGSYIEFGISLNEDDDVYVGGCCTVPANVHTADGAMVYASNVIIAGYRYHT